MGLIDSAFDAFRFKETVFFKDNSDLQLKYDALIKLNNEHPDNKDIQSELCIVKKGLEGENEIAYQLKKSNIGMYVLRDIKLKYEDLTAQVDYVIITPVFIYYVECKNLSGDITVTDKGDFIREITTIDGKKVKKGMYSPLRQVEAQREVIRKIWESKKNKMQKFFASSNFDYYRRVLVVAANPDTILNTSKAPKDMKYKILRADALIRQIGYDLEHKNAYDYVETKKGMEEIAQSYLDLSSKENVDYYEYYKKKYFDSSSDDILKEKLIKFQKKRMAEMNIPDYYVFTNEELEKLIKAKPKTLKDLKNSKILSPIKVRTHGSQIIEILNIYYQNQ